MDMLRVNRTKSQKQGKKKRNSIKVVYISSPMKVETSASKFRATVQELTGRDSDVARIMEGNGGDDSRIDRDGGFKGGDDYLLRMPTVEACRESPTSSDSLVEAFDDVLVPQMDEGFLGMLESSFLFESCHGDELRSFEYAL